MEIYLTGGAVRDAHIYGNFTSHKDWDFVIIAPSFEDMVAQFEASGGKVYKLQPEFGRLRGFWKGYNGDFMVGRIDGFYPDGRHPETIQIAESIELDLQRRDLAFNAMAVPVDPETGVIYWNEVIDLFGGLDDIRNKVIRPVGNIIHRVTEDALRLMRWYRFQAQLPGFTPDLMTVGMIESEAEMLGHALSKISSDRRRGELYLMFQADSIRSIHILSRIHIAILNAMFSGGIKLSPTNRILKEKLQ
jgi:tRNA nucleotidyltransferase (CCA-adding enzyme)